MLLLKKIIENEHMKKKYLDKKAGHFNSKFKTYNMYYNFTIMTNDGIEVYNMYNNIKTFFLNNDYTDDEVRFYLNCDFENFNKNFDKTIYLSQKCKIIRKNKKNKQLKKLTK